MHSPENIQSEYICVSYFRHVKAHLASTLILCAVNQICMPIILKCFVFHCTYLLETNPIYIMYISAHDSITGIIFRIRLDKLFIKITSRRRSKTFADPNIHKPRHNVWIVLSISPVADAIKLRKQNLKRRSQAKR